MDAEHDLQYSSFSPINREEVKDNIRYRINIDDLSLSIDTDDAGVEFSDYDEIKPYFDAYLADSVLRGEIPESLKIDKHNLSCDPTFLETVLDFDKNTFIANALRYFSLTDCSFGNSDAEFFELLELKKKLTFLDYTTDLKTKSNK